MSASACCSGKLESVAQILGSDLANFRWSRLNEEEKAKMLSYASAKFPCTWIFFTMPIKHHIALLDLHFVLQRPLVAIEVQNMQPEVYQYLSNSVATSGDVEQILTQIYTAYKTHVHSPSRRSYGPVYADQPSLR